MQFYNPALYSPSGSGPAIPWTEDIHLPGSSQMQYVKQVILDRDASPLDRIPDQSLIVDNPGTNAEHLVATRDKNGDYILVYTPTGAPFTVDASKLQGNGSNVRSSWFDPVVGTYQAFNWTDQANTTVTPPTSSDHKDWVLVLEA
jgi:hypothetical protein